MPIVLVLGLRHAHDLEIGVGGIANTGVVHCTRSCSLGPASQTGCILRLISAVLVLRGRGAARWLRRRVWLGMAGSPHKPVRRGR